MNSGTNHSGRVIALWLGVGVLIGALVMAALGRFPIGPIAQAQRPINARAIANVGPEGLELLRNLDEAFSGVANYALGSVVHIRAESTRGADAEGRFVGVMGGQGSGVIYRPDGYIITNDHVVNGFDKVTVRLNDGKEYSGKVIRSEDSDIAVVKIDASGLNALPFGDSSKVRPGQFAIAVGSPFGLENSVTIGHVSAVGRPSTVPDPSVAFRARYYPDMIQTDAAINMGNSGGPLVNVQGEVIGINTAIYSRTGENVGIGFAIPANQARLIADLLIEKGKIVRGYLGVLPQSLKEYQKKEMGIAGGAIVGPMDNSQPSPARDAGLKEGDIITKIGALPVNNEMDLRNAMLRYGPGETVKIEFIRDGKVKSLSVKLIEPPKLAEERARPNRRSIPPEELGIPDFGDWQQKLEEWQKRFDSQGPEADVPPIRSGPARLGVTVESPTETLRKQFHIPAGEQGAVVTAVEPSSAAERFGIKVGDIIQQLGATQIKSSADLKAAMSKVKWGDKVSLKISRYGESSQLTIQRDLVF